MPETIRLEIAHHLDDGQKIATTVELDVSVDSYGGLAAYLSTEDNARRVQLALDKITATLSWRAAFAEGDVAITPGDTAASPAAGDHGGACIAHEDGGHMCGCGACIYSD